ncbi:hypothetical protein F511_45997 [Dorcoceras hygrometricum]|uniref:Uncharacterized protein n=1 Tax=Dorcoceras hygrometricum TaxID=472368 RepID=A0A2Z7A1Z7_9LAMI|nr:hypothetical protein F511_45997 [Dorcoceras hygrometricum]
MAAPLLARLCASNRARWTRNGRSTLPLLAPKLVDDLRTTPRRWACWPRMDWRSLGAASRELSRTAALLCAMDAADLLHVVVDGCATMVDDERRWKRCWPTQRRSPLRTIGRWLHAGRAMRARCDAAVEHALMRRAKFFVATAPAGRRSGESPAMS